MTVSPEQRQQWASEAQQWRAASAAIRAKFAPAEPATAQPAPGLVCLSTTDTPQACTEEEKLFEVDTEAARLKRMKRRVCKSAELHEKAMKGSTDAAPAMVTLTYRDGGDWKPNHLKEALKRVRQWLARRGHGFRYVWVGELQGRGAIHYHILAWFPARYHGSQARKVQDTPPFWGRRTRNVNRTDLAEKANYDSGLLWHALVETVAQSRGSCAESAFSTRPNWVTRKLICL